MPGACTSVGLLVCDIVGGGAGGENGGKSAESVAGVLVIPNVDGVPGACTSVAGLLVCNIADGGAGGENGGKSPLTVFSVSVSESDEIFFCFLQKQAATYSYAQNIFRVHSHSYEYESGYLYTGSSKHEFACI